MLLTGSMLLLLFSGGMCKRMSLVEGSDLTSEMGGSMIHVRGALLLWKSPAVAVAGQAVLGWCKVPINGSIGMSIFWLSLKKEWYDGL